MMISKSPYENSIVHKNIKGMQLPIAIDHDEGTTYGATVPETITRNRFITPISSRMDKRSASIKSPKVYG